MGKKKSDDQRLVKLALITAVLALITELVSFAEKLIDWLITRP